MARRTLWWHVSMESREKVPQTSRYPTGRWRYTAGISVWVMEGPLIFCSTSSHDLYLHRPGVAIIRAVTAEVGGRALQAALLI